MQKTMLTSLPTEILLNCFKYLDHFSISSLSRTNNYLRNVIREYNKTIYNDMLQRDFGNWITRPSDFYKILLYDKLNPSFYFFNHILTEDYEYLLSKIICNYDKNGIHLLSTIGIQFEICLGNIFRYIIESNDLTKLEFIHQNINVDFANPLIVDNSGNTPYMASLFSTVVNLEIKNYLLFNMKAVSHRNIRCVNDKNKTILCLYFDNMERTPIEHILHILSFDPDLNHKTSDTRRNVFTNAVLKGCDNHLLLAMLDTPSPININDQDEELMTVLMHSLNFSYISSEYPSEEFLLKLLDYPGLDIEIQSKHEETALVYLSNIFNKNITTRVIEKFFAKNPNVNVKDLRGLTPLMILMYNKHFYEHIYASYKKHINDISNVLIYKIIELNPDFNIKNRLGENILMVLFKYNYFVGYRDIIEILLNKDFDIDSQDIMGNTVTILALKRYIYDNTFFNTESFDTNKYIILRLLDKNPNIMLYNSHKESIMSLICDNQRLFDNSITEKICKLRITK